MTDSGAPAPAAVALYCAADARISQSIRDFLATLALRVVPVPPDAVPGDLVGYLEHAGAVLVLAGPSPVTAGGIDDVERAVRLGGVAALAAVQRPGKVILAELNGHPTCLSDIGTAFGLGAPVRLDNELDGREELVRHLVAAGCVGDVTAGPWQVVGDFSAGALPAEGPRPHAGLNGGTEVELGVHVDLKVTYVKARHIFARNGIEVTNQEPGPLHNLAVIPLGAELFGVQILGSPLPSLPPGQPVPLFFQPDAAKVRELRLRFTGTREDGEPFLRDMVVRR